MFVKTLSLEDRFWAKVLKAAPESCWLWTSYKTKEGYGVFKIKPKTILAHRLAYKLAYADLPEKLLVCHKCDTPSCCNPGHLFLGTAKDNAKDKSDKGRCPKIQPPNIRKITHSQEQDIRTLFSTGTYTKTRLAKKFGCSVQNICYLLNKTPKGKLEASQEREIPRMQAAGATILIVRSLKELQENLDALEVGD